MFSKKVQIEISPEAREALDRIRGDVEGLTSLIQELLKSHAALVGIVNGDLAVKVARATGDPVDGIEVFEGDEPPGQPIEPDLVPAGEDKGPAESDIENERPGDKPELPESMKFQSFDETSKGDPERMRTSPWSRTPRHVQVEWLKERMKDGAWYAAPTIAREEATDERHHRYLRHAVGGRLKEMWDEGMVERRDSHVRGALFEYRMIKKEAS